MSEEKAFHDVVEEDRSKLPPVHPFVLTKKAGQFQGGFYNNGMWAVVAGGSVTELLEQVELQQKEHAQRCVVVNGLYNALGDLFIENGFLSSSACHDPECVTCCAVADEEEAEEPGRDIFSPDADAKLQDIQGRYGFALEQSVEAKRARLGSYKAAYEDVLEGYQIAVNSDAVPSLVSFMEDQVDLLREIVQGQADEEARDRKATEYDFNKKTGDEKEYPKYPDFEKLREEPSLPEGMDTRLAANDILKKVAETIADAIGQHICWDGEDGG